MTCSLIHPFEIATSRYDSLLAAWRVGPAGKVVAIEASPLAFELLQANLRMNDYAKNVRPVQLAVSDRPGKLDLCDLSKYNMAPQPQSLVAAALS